MLFVALIIQIRFQAHMQNSASLNIVFNQNLEKESEWHFLPLHFKNYQTSIPNAKINEYFRPSIQDGNIPSSVFQGNLLRGTKSKEDQLYKVICYSSEENHSDKEMVVTERVGQTVDWRKDTPWQMYEGHLGSIHKYQLVQNALHDQ